MRAWGIMLLKTYVSEDCMDYSVGTWKMLGIKLGLAAFRTQALTTVLFYVLGNQP